MFKIFSLDSSGISRLFKTITQRDKSSTYRLFGFKLYLIYNGRGEPLDFMIAERSI